ncbi:MAG: methyltransferase domain-containing protein [Pedobacter sp.]|nr:MAG: methyltransferase domain-containing protein [Pedobacter sp.]
MEQIFNKEAFRESASPVDHRFLSTIKKCLVLAPHPDDESLGCGGLLAYLAAQGCDIQVIFSTDGSMSHPNSHKYPAAALAALRKAEALEALKILGISHQYVNFYALPDSALPALAEPGFEANTARLESDLKLFQPQLILVPYELDPHRDHRATWQMLMEALKNTDSANTIIWEYPIWLYQNATAKDVPQLKTGELKAFDTSQFLEQKKTAIAAHLSQTTDLIDDDPRGFRLTQEMIANFTISKEYYMQRAALNLGKTMPGDYFEKLYTENPDPWNFQTSEYEKAKYKHTIDSLPNTHFKRALEIGCSIGVLTEMLAEKCDQLLSVDISEQALKLARKRLEHKPNVLFKVAGVPAGFPEGQFDLIVMSEVGYYLSLNDLKETFKRMVQQLNTNGVLILVHWTHYVEDYPLTGDEVHEGFQSEKMEHLKADRTADYRLDVYQKIQL